MTTLSLHAGVSTMEPQLRQAAIPFSAFAEAVDDYKADDTTDSEGDMRNA